MADTRLPENTALQQYIHPQAAPAVRGMIMRSKGRKYGYIHRGTDSSVAAC